MGSSLGRLVRQCAVAERKDINSAHCMVFLCYLYLFFVQWLGLYSSDGTGEGLCLISERYVKRSGDARIT